MGESGETKDDVKVPDGEVGEKIEKLFRTDEKDTSELICLGVYENLTDTLRRHCSYFYG